MMDHFMDEIIDEVLQFYKLFIFSKMWALLGLLLFEQISAEKHLHKVMGNKKRNGYNS